MRVRARTIAGGVRVARGGRHALRHLHAERGRDPAGAERGLAGGGHRPGGGAGGDDSVVDPVVSAASATEVRAAPRKVVRRRVGIRRPGARSGRDWLTSCMRTPSPSGTRQLAGSSLRSSDHPVSGVSGARAGWPECGFFRTWAEVAQVTFEAGNNRGRFPRLNRCPRETGSASPLGSGPGRNPGSTGPTRPDRRALDESVAAYGPWKNPYQPYESAQQGAKS